MEYYDLFTEGPSAYVPVLVISLLITIAVYCAFPLLYAKLRRKPITALKYRVHCFLVNFLIMLVFKLITVGSSTSPYFLWSTVFTYSGVKNLKSRGVLLDPKMKECAGKYAQNTEQESDTIINTVPSPDSLPSEITPAKPKKAKSRFCKLCGNSIDPATKKCTGCGKQYFRLPVIKKNNLIPKVIVILSLLIVGLCIYRNVQYQNQITSLNARISELESTVETMEAQHVSDEALISDLRKKNAGYSSKIYTLSQQVEKMQPVYDFCNDHVVVVSDDGTRKYHKIQCIYFDDSYFWAYNTEKAVQLGYTPCSFCFSSTNLFWDSISN